MSDLLVYNPLPRALAHYAKALDRALGGMDLLAAPGVEAGGLDPARKALRLLRHLRALGASSNRPLLDVWPGLGHWECAALGRRRARAAVVFHDPEPLRGAQGYGARARRAGARSDVVVVAHSHLAAQRLSEQGYRDVVHVPHPVLPAVDSGPRQDVVRVLGQHKATRDVRLIGQLATRLAAEGLRLEVLGRGWPAIEGAVVRDEFLTESAFDEALRTSAAVLIPYRRYWQSGVALRALERGTPVVGPAEGHLGEVLGDVPSLVNEVDDVEAWVVAVGAARGQRPDTVAAALADHDRAAREALGQLAARLVA